VDVFSGGVVVRFDAAKTSVEDFRRAIDGSTYDFLGASPVSAVTRFDGHRWRARVVRDGGALRLRVGVEEEEPPARSYRIAVRADAPLAADPGERTLHRGRQRHVAFELATAGASASAARPWVRVTLSPEGGASAPRELSLPVEPGPLLASERP